MRQGDSVTFGLPIHWTIAGRGDGNRLLLDAVREFVVSFDAIPNNFAIAVESFIISGDVRGILIVEVETYDSETEGWIGRLTRGLPPTPCFGQAIRCPMLLYRSTRVRFKILNMSSVHTFFFPAFSGTVIEPRAFQLGKL